MKTLACLPLVFALALTPAAARAGGPGSSSCATGRFCDPHLGISLRLSAGWYVVGLKQLAGSNQVAFALPNHGPSHTLRLIMRAYAVTSFTNSRRSARVAANKLIRAERVTNARETAVHYAGTYGLLIAGLPGRHYDISA